MNPPNTTGRTPTNQIHWPVTNQVPMAKRPPPISKAAARRNGIETLSEALPDEAEWWASTTHPTHSDFKSVR
jgi:hypothetical protein